MVTSVAIRKHIKMSTYHVFRGHLLTSTGTFDDKQGDS